MRKPSSIVIDRRGVEAPVAVTATVLVVCLLIVAGIALADSLSGDADDGVRTAVNGDPVAVNFIGTYDNGMVFDTSLWSVANDDKATKSFTFEKRQQSQYTPMEIEIGEQRLLPKFESALIGMAPGETKTIALTPEEGYGSVPDSKLKAHDRVEELPLRQTMNLTGFEDFFGEAAAKGLVVAHPVYGWDVIVETYNPSVDEIVVRNQPVEGMEYWSYGDREASEGWKVKVNALGSESITIENLLSASMVNSVKGIDAYGEKFFLHALDDEKMYFKYSEERVGQNLNFEITLVEFLD